MTEKEKREFLYSSESHLFLAPFVEVLKGSGITTPIRLLMESTWNGENPEEWFSKLKERRSTI